jgi:hypothetical protein
MAVDRVIVRRMTDIREAMAMTSRQEILDKLEIQFGECETILRRLIEAGEI